MSAGTYTHGHVLASYLWFWEPLTRSLYFDVGKSATYVYPSSVRSSAYNLEVRKPAGKISELRQQTVSSPTILSLWELNVCWIQLPKQLMREGQLMAKQVHTSSITRCVETAGPSMHKLIPLLNTTAPWGWDKLSLLDEGTAMSVATNISADPSFKASQKWWQKLLTTQQRNIQANKSRNNNTPLEMKCPKSKKDINIWLYGVLVVALACFPMALIDLLLKDWVIPPWHVTTCRGKDFRPEQPEK